MNSNTKSNLSIAELEKVLMNEIHLYESYAEQLEKDTDLMVALKIDELEQSNKTKATLLMRIQAVEEGRQLLVKKIAEEKGLSPEGVKVSDICERIDQRDGEKLLKLREKLLEVIGRIHDIQNQAGQLVQSSLSWIEGSMATLKRLLSPSGTYNSRGKVDHPQSFAGRVVENKA